MTQQEDTIEDRLINNCGLFYKTYDAKKITFNRLTIIVPLTNQYTSTNLCVMHSSFDVNIAHIGDSQYHTLAPHVGYIVAYSLTPTYAIKSI